MGTYSLLYMLRTWMDNVLYLKRGPDCWGFVKEDRFRAKNAIHFTKALRRLAQGRLSFVANTSLKLLKGEGLKS